MQTLARQVLPRERVALCMRGRVGTSPFVTLLHDPDKLRAWYGNLITCGSVWHCPVCAAKISERRRVELTAGIASARVQGLHPVMVTYTLQHAQDEPLADVLGGLQDTVKRVKQGKSYQMIKAAAGLVGTVGALECTWGAENGWHPHRHEIWLLDQEPTPLALNALQGRLTDRYIRFLKKRGRWASWRHGLSVDYDRQDPYKRIADYISKFGRHPAQDTDLNGWTMAHEMTKAIVKQAEPEHYTPFQLLALSGQNQQAKALFMEYAYAFKGRQQLTYSPGLKEILAVPIETDSTIADDVSDYPVLLALLNSKQWAAVLVAEARGQLLRAAADGDPARVHDFLQKLGDRLGIDLLTD